jgi:hypothetical protein
VTQICGKRDKRHVVGHIIGFLGFGAAGQTFASGMGSAKINRTERGRYNLDQILVHGTKGVADMILRAMR